MAGTPAVAQSASFDGLGDIRGGFGTSRGMAISADGGVIVGYAYDMTQTPVAVLWRPGDTDLEPLGYLPGGGDSYAYGVSADGSTIVGESNGPSMHQAFRWTEGGGMQGLGNLPGGNFSAAYDVSADGSVIVGRARDASTYVAFRWTQGGGMVSLGGLPSASQSEATAVSDDGEVVVGWSRFSGSFPTPPTFGAFRWTEALGMVALGDLTGDNRNSWAYGISGDGEVIVGAVDTGSSRVPFRWTQSGGMVDVGSLAIPDGVANDANFDGSVIVGDDDAGHATVWTQPNGMRFVADVLTDAGIDMSDWNLQTAQGVSADGEIVVGYGDRISGVGGNLEAWIAQLDLGIVSLADVRLSLSSVVGIGQSGQQVESAHMNGLIDLAGTNGAPEPVGGWSAWGGISYANYNILEIDPEARQGDLGFAYQLTNAWRLGAGVRWGGREDDVLVFDGENDSTYGGLSVFAAYEPSPRGLRVHSAFAANWIQNDIERGYLNGSTLTSSRGEQNGFAYGAALRVGWAAPLRNGIAVTPFVSYEASRIELDGYTETTGPFPAQFNDIKGNLDIGRAGAQLDMQAGDALRFWLTGDYAMRRQRELPGVSGEVMALSSPFAIEGAEMNRQWWEAGLGAEWRASARTRLQVGLTASTDGDTAAHYGTRVSAIVAF
jgi:probable HAF family extracellular repeat protein